MAKDLRALLLDEDVAGFNRARTPGERIDLFAEDLSGLKLIGVDLSTTNLDKSDLTGADLSTGRLAKSFLCEADAPGIVLARTLSVMAKIKDSDLSNADLTGADFGRADLSASRLPGSRAEGARFAGARMKETSAPGAMWARVDLQEAILERADLSGTDLSEAKLTDLQGHGVKLDGARLDGASGTGVDLRKASLVGASLRGVSLVGVRLDDADLTGADLTDADLTRASLVRCKLDGAKLHNTKLALASLDGVSVAGATWIGADLTGTDARGVGLGEEAVATLAAWGAAAAESSETIYGDVAAAVVGEVSCLLWPNVEGAESSTVRWQLWKAGACFARGVLPVSGPSVLAHAALPFRGGFALCCLAERPGGSTVMRWELDLGGELTGPIAGALGYEPSVLPVFRSDGDKLWMWGISRRGPSVVVHRDDGAGFVRAVDQVWAQARGLIGQGRPVLLCKAGTLVSLSEAGIGAPFRAPDRFPSKVHAAVTVGDRMIVVWNADKVGRDKGGLRWQLLGERVAPEPEELTTAIHATLLDAVADNDGAWLGWCEPIDKLASRVRMLRVPSGEGVAFRVDGPPPEELKWVESASGRDLLVLLASGALVRVSPEGKVIAQFRDDEQSA